MMPDEDDLRIHEEERARLPDLRAAWIPVSLHGRETLAVRDGRGAWADAFRGYPGGFTFTMHYKWGSGSTAQADPDAWPEFAALVREADPVTITARVDGHLRSSRVQGKDALHVFECYGVPGIGHATWWVPELPESALILGFAHPSIGFEGSARVDTSGWKSAVEEGVIRLG